MQLIDTHAHLYLEQFGKDRDEIVKRALDAGISHMLLPNIDRSSVSSMMHLHDKFPQHCIPMMAIHPTSVKNDYIEQLEFVEKQLEEHKFCAVGETGIDLYWDKTYLKEQSVSFEKHIELAVKHDLPLVIHSRNSLNEIFDILENAGKLNLKGVFHCFPGNIEQALKAIDMGFLIGIGGVVTFKNSKMAVVTKEIDLKHIVLETDAPYLAPVPKRGERNESSFLTYIADKIAEIKDVESEQVATITTSNAKNLFGLK